MRGGVAHLLQVASVQRERIDIIYAVLGPPLHQTHNSWQPSDSFLFSYPLPSLCSLRGCHSDREWRADPGAGPPTGLTVGTPGPHLSPLVPAWLLSPSEHCLGGGSGESQRAQLLTDILKQSQHIVEQNGSPVNMRRSDNECNYKLKCHRAGLWNNKMKVRSMFCLSQMRF